MSDGGNVTELMPGTRLMVEDLAKSGLSPEMVRARPLGSAERAATGTPNQVSGYVIPYFDINSKAVPFYRVKLHEWDPKYRQAADLPNHIYFPPGFKEILAKCDPQLKCVILTEGEKKAAACCAAGLPAVAVGGVDSWRNKVMTLPKDTKLTSNKNGVLARVSPGQELYERTESIADGLPELIQLCKDQNIPIVIIYDTEVGTRNHFLPAPVAAAAARLGYELRFRGLPMRLIRQLVLAPGASYQDPKLGLDDYIRSTHLGPKLLRDALRAVLHAKSAFPQHPNPGEYVNKKLIRGKLPRQELQALSTAILCDLDSKGTRYWCPDDDRNYYFDDKTHELLPVKFRMDENFAKSPFGVHLFKSYNITAGDFRVMAQLAAQFSAEEPILEVQPEKVLVVKGNSLYYDIGNGRQVRCNGQGINFLNNGADSVLFATGHVKALDENELRKKVLELQKQPKLDDRWYQVLVDTRIAPSENDYQRKLLALLYVISPWFYRWQNTQLPIEMMTGEAGSGKSSLYSLRMHIVTGLARLRNAPRDMRDWAASVANSGGMHVTDNVHMADQRLRQELSDELCRVITADIPTIEARKLYTDNDLVTIPVQTIFAITSIKQPFTNVDIIQRSIITELYKGTGSTDYEENWAQHQCDKWGGREAWIAYQLVFQERMFQQIGISWQRGYKAKYRLINVEQLLKHAAQVLGWESEWIVKYLEASLNEIASDADWALTGLSTFATDWRKSYGSRNSKQGFLSKDIAEWAAGEDEFSDCHILTNTRSLGKYIKSHANMVARVAGIEARGTKANAVVYWAIDPAGG